MRRYTIATVDKPTTTSADRPGVSRVLPAGAMPAAMLATLAASGGARDGALAAFPADLSTQGRFAERWLVVCRDALAVLETDGAGGFRAGAREAFRGVTGLDYRGEVGGGLVLVKRGKEQRELVRCSRACDRAIQAALGKLRTHLELDKPTDGKPDAAAKPAEPSAPASPGAGAADALKLATPEPPPREALPELSAEAAATFLGQLSELGEQRYCATCGLPLKQDTAICPVCLSTGRTLARVLRLALAYRGLLAALLLLLGVTTLLSLLPPYIHGQVFDRALVPKVPRPAGERFAYLLLLIGAWAGTELLLAGMRVLQGRVSVRIGASVSRDLRGRVFNHLQLLSLGYFDRHKTGALMSRVNSDSQHLEGFLVDGVVWTLVSMLQATLVTAWLMYCNWPLALLVILPAPLVVLCTRLVWRRLMGRFRRLWEILSRMSAALNDSLRGIRVVKAFGREGQEIARFDRHNQASCTAMIGAEQTWATLMPFMQFIMGLGGYLVWLTGGSLVIDEALTPGTLVMFMGYTPMLYGPLGVLTRVNQWFTRSMTAAERIFEILDTRPEVAEAPDAVAMPRIAGRIEMRGASFGYEKHTPVIKGMTLEIAAGEMIGLVGHSGAGKTTTVNLITRLYDLDEGQVLIDGVDVRKIRVEDLRRQTGVVLQETFLFSGTVYENIAYAQPDARPEDVIAAAKLANAHDFVMSRPDGYDSEVEESGGNFSSGEKQRLAIARAILHDPRILILDEATSSVDTKTEQQIQEAIVRLTEGRTTIAIAHRLSTLREADRLIVLEKGRVKDAGTHEELVAREGVYRDLVKAQTEMSSVMAVAE